MRIIDFFDSVGRDLRHAQRSLRRRPAFTLAAVLTLALGIGATTAIFSVVYSVVIKPLPYPNADELVRIRHTAPGLGAADMVASTNMYLTYAQENRAFAALGLWRSDDSATLTDRGEASACGLCESRTGRCRRSACNRCADVGSRELTTTPAPTGRRP